VKIRDGCIDLPITVEVGGNNVTCVGRGTRVINRILEASVPVSEKNRDSADVIFKLIVGRSHQVGLAIPIDVRRCDPATERDCIVHRILEGSVAVAQQHADAAAFAVRGREIKLVIAVEIGHRYRLRSFRAWVARTVFESTVALAQQDVNCIIARSCDVELSVAIEISNADAVYLKGRGGNNRFLKGPIAVAEQNADALAWILIGQRRYIWLAVPIEVTGKDRVLKGGERGALGAVAKASITVCREGRLAACREN
jgi:hypothetical protein